MKGNAIIAYSYPSLSREICTEILEILETGHEDWIFKKAQQLSEYEFENRTFHSKLLYLLIAEGIGDKSGSA